jgi:hypothetical protein
MTGEENGVAAPLKQTIGHLISIHCIAHRGHLGACNAFDGVPFCANLDELLRALGRFFSHRRRERRRGGSNGGGCNRWWAEGV